jgi:hypothetical protein
MLSCQVSNPRVSKGINEKIYLHTDRLFYIAGERIWFRIYLLEEGTMKQAGFSRVAYVELISNRSEVITRQKVRTDPSGGAGYLDIPGEIPSGYYFIRSYTNWMKNFDPAGYFISALAVVNPGSRLYEYIDTATFSESDARQSIPGETIKENLSDNSENLLDVIVHNVNPEYRCREKVDLEIVTTGADGNPLSSDISISVFYSGDKEFHPPEIQDYLSSDSGIKQEMTAQDSDYQKFIFIPEMEGLTISGRIMDPSGQDPVQDMPVILSVVGESAFLKSYLTRADGMFYFSMDNIYGENDVVLSHGSQPDDYLIIVDEPYSETFVELPELGLNLDESWRSFIEKQMINFQLTSIYKGGPISFHPDSSRIMEPFYINPDFTILMEDFIRLPNMEEVFRELVKQVLVTRENGELTLNVLDNNTNRIIGPKPLFLLDGMPFFDAGLIFELNPEEIESIHIVSHKYYKGILEMDGIIDIRTNGGDLPVSEMPANTIRHLFHGYQPQQEFTSPDYSDGQKLKSRIPDFRNLLYWDPSVKTDNTGKAHISFYTSDNTANYIISIKGMSPDGFFSSAFISFRVLK